MPSPAKRKMPYHNLSLANFKKRVKRLDKKRALLTKGSVFYELPQRAGERFVMKFTHGE